MKKMNRSFRLILMKKGTEIIHRGVVVQRVDNAIHRTNCYPMDSLHVHVDYICVYLVNNYPLVAICPLDSVISLLNKLG